MLTGTVSRTNRVHLRGDCLLPNLVLRSRYYGRDLTHGRRPRRNWIARSRP